MAPSSPTVPLPAVLLEPLQRSWTEGEAFAFCRRLTQAHYENFPVGSLLLPRKIQPAVHSLYAFMRTADDFADENRVQGDETERLAALEAWGAWLEEAARGHARHPIFIALASTLRSYDLPVQWLRDLLTAFRMDVTVRRYATFAEVERYCRYSANPVGRLILALFGYRDDARSQASDAICTGLQLANHWQDVAVDLAKDRIYLPQEDLSRFGVTEDQLKKRRCDPAFQALLRFQVERARGIFELGKNLPWQVRGRLRWELRLTWLGGMRILEKIEAVGYDVFQHRPIVNRGDWARLLGRTLIGL